MHQTTLRPMRMSESSSERLRMRTLETGTVIRAVLKHVAQTHNMSALARDTGLNRGNLYEALSEDGNPTLETLLKVTRSLGLRLSLEPVENSAISAQRIKA